MTTEEAADQGADTYDINNDPDGYTREELNYTDFYLHTYLDMALGLDDKGVEGAVSLTLTMPGGTVTGLAVTVESWMKRFQEHMPEKMDKFMEDYRTVHEAARDLALEEYTERKERRLPTVPRRYVHMVDVTVLNGPEPVRLPFWRGLLTEVTGWSPVSAN